MIRTIISYFPKKEKIKVQNPSGLAVVLTRQEFEDSLNLGDEFTIQLKDGVFTFSKNTYDKIKDRLWKTN